MSTTRLTTTDHEDARGKIITVFAEADVFLATHDEPGSEAEMAVVNHAFETAERYGWDYTNDEEWYLWSLKATQREIVQEGLLRALKGITNEKLLRLKDEG